MWYHCFFFYWSGWQISYITGPALWISLYGPCLWASSLDSKEGRRSRTQSSGSRLPPSYRFSPEPLARALGSPSLGSLPGSVALEVRGHTAGVPALKMASVPRSLTSGPVALVAGGRIVAQMERTSFRTGLPP